MLYLDSAKSEIVISFRISALYMRKKKEGAKAEAANLFFFLIFPVFCVLFSAYVCAIKKKKRKIKRKNHKNKKCILILLKHKRANIWKRSFSFGCFGLFPRVFFLVLRRAKQKWKVNNFNFSKTSSFFSFHRRVWMSLPSPSLERANSHASTCAPRLYMSKLPLSSTARERERKSNVQCGRTHKKLVSKWERQKTKKKLGKIADKKTEKNDIRTGWKKKRKKRVHTSVCEMNEKR